jgi:hypothetical protein
MIKDSRDVIDPRRLLNNAKEKIIVLRAIKFRSETSDLPQNFTPDQSKVTDVIAGEKEIERPVRLENRGIQPLLSELVLVGIY